MSKLNETQKERLRVISSETAKKTSARPEILEARTKKLAEWREREPEAFQNKCVWKLTNTFHSIPEKHLYELLSGIMPNFWDYSGKLYDERFDSKSGWRQIDVLSKDKFYVVEFDGPRHFRQLLNGEPGVESLKRIVNRDIALNEILSDKKCVIRIAQSMYSYKSGFSFEIIEKILDIIQKQKPGLYRFGKEYGQN